MMANNSISLCTFEIWIIAEGIFKGSIDGGGVGWMRGWWGKVISFLHSNKQQARSAAAAAAKAAVYCATAVLIPYNPPSSTPQQCIYTVPGHCSKQPQQKHEHPSHTNRFSHRINGFTPKMAGILRDHTLLVTRQQGKGSPSRKAQQALSIVDENYEFPIFHPWPT